MINSTEQTTFDDMYASFLKPALEHLVNLRLPFSKSWNYVDVTEDSSVVTIRWHGSKVDSESLSFHEVRLPYSFRSLNNEIYNQYLKLSRKS